MPYVKMEKRLYLRATKDMESSGDLNYLITDICNSYLSIKGLSYTTLNEIIGALECAKSEFYRRVVVPYEEQKIKDNGDVYDN